MADYLKELFQDIGIDYLKKNPTIQNIKEALAAVEEVRLNAAVLLNKASETDTQSVKIGTVLVFATIEQLLQKNKDSLSNNLKDLSRDDWKAIAEKVSDIAVKKPEEEYSVFVFDLYKQYIDTSCGIFSSIFTEDELKNMNALTDQLEANKTSFESGKLSEADYIEQSLWICLEAMVKLLSCFICSQIASLVGEKAYSDLLKAASTFALEYARYFLYHREEELLAQYLKNQSVLDNELANQYNAYIEDLNSAAERFNSLIENAFSIDFQSSFKASVLFAEELGVKEKDLLKSVDEIDDFFMN